MKVLPIAAIAALINMSAAQLVDSSIQATKAPCPSVEPGKIYPYSMIDCIPCPFVLSSDQVVYDIGKCATQSPQLPEIVSNFTIINQGLCGPRCPDLNLLVEFSSGQLQCVYSYEPVVTQGCLQFASTGECLKYGMIYNCPEGGELYNGKCRVLSEPRYIECPSATASSTMSLAATATASSTATATASSTATATVTGTRTPSSSIKVAPFIGNNRTAAASVAATVTTSVSATVSATVTTEVTATRSAVVTAAATVTNTKKIMSESISPSLSSIVVNYTPRPSASETQKVVDLKYTESASLTPKIIDYTPRPSASETQKVVDLKYTESASLTPKVVDYTLHPSPSFTSEVVQDIRFTESPSSKIVDYSSRPSASETQKVVQDTTKESASLTPKIIDYTPRPSASETQKVVDTRFSESPSSKVIDYTSRPTASETMTQKVVDPRESASPSNKDSQEHTFSESPSSKIIDYTTRPSASETQKVVDLKYTESPSSKVIDYTSRPTKSPCELYCPFNYTLIDSSCIHKIPITYIMRCNKSDTLISGKNMCISYYVSIGMTKCTTGYEFTTYNGMNVCAKYYEPNIDYCFADYEYYDGAATDATAATAATAVTTSVRDYCYKIVDAQCKTNAVITDIYKSPYPSRRIRTLSPVYSKKPLFTPIAVSPVVIGSKDILSITIAAVDVEIIVDTLDELKAIIGMKYNVAGDYVLIKEIKRRVGDVEYNLTGLLNMARALEIIQDKTTIEYSIASDTSVSSVNDVSRDISYYIQRVVDHDVIKQYYGNVTVAEVSDMLYSFSVSSAATLDSTAATDGAPATESGVSKPLANGLIAGIVVIAAVCAAVIAAFISFKIANAKNRSAAKKMMNGVQVVNNGVGGRQVVMNTSYGLHEYGPSPV